MGLAWVTHLTNNNIKGLRTQIVFSLYNENIVKWSQALGERKKEKEKSSSKIFCVKCKLKNRYINTALLQLQQGLASNFLKM